MPATIVVLDLAHVRIVQINQMTWSDGHLAVTSRDVEHVGRLAQTGMSRPQRPHESLTRWDACAQMRSPRGKIGVMQVIRLDPTLDQGAHQSPKGVCVIIDP